MKERKYKCINFRNIKVVLNAPTKNCPVPNGFPDEFSLIFKEKNTNAVQTLSENR